MQRRGLNQLDDFGSRAGQIDQQHQIKRSRDRIEMRNLLGKVVFVQPKVFLRQIVEGAVGAPIDHADIDTHEFGVDANDVALRNFLRFIACRITRIF